MSNHATPMKVLARRVSPTQANVQAGHAQASHASACSRPRAQADKQLQIVFVSKIHLDKSKIYQLTLKVNTSLNMINSR